MQKPRLSLIAAALAVALITNSGFSLAAGVTPAMQGSTLTFQAQGFTAVADASLRVSGPNGFLMEKTTHGTLPAMETVVGGKSLADGSYNFELTVRQPMPAALQAEFDAALAKDDGTGSGLDASLASRVAAYGFTASGPFGILNGALLVPPATTAGKKRDGAGTAVGDQVIADDLIVQGSACIGLDCVNNESFGFDTIRLKENNTRIKFEDTSASPGFPHNSWQLTANDSASGGAEKFSIEDITGAKVPFTITGGARTNSIFVDSTGRVGLGTSTPVLDLHVSNSNTPAFRMEQTNAGGFTAQTWDIGSNEANFFVRDVTGGSRLPFRIRPGAPTSSIDINSSGNVGIGTASPVKPLHIQRSDGTAMLFVEEKAATVAQRNLIALDNANGDAVIRMRSQTGGNTNSWHLISGVSDFRINFPSSVSKMTLDASGNMTIAGTLTQGSSREIKDLTLADPKSFLKAIAALPLYTWNYKNTGAHDQHLGPTAEDFHASFRLGADNKHIAPSDVAGVALAAVKALTLQVAARDAELSSLRKQLKQLEKMVRTQASKK